MEPPPTAGDTSSASLFDFVSFLVIFCWVVGASEPLLYDKLMTLDPIQKCAICNGTSGTRYIFREMMFGTREEFLYWECCTCGYLQIVQVPENLSAYYPDNYHSFSARLSLMQRLFCRLYAKVPGLVELFHSPGEKVRSVLDAKLRAGARILDVGCGAGKLVMALRGMGFDAHGIDPFLRSETDYVRPISLTNVPQGWDLIMFHHSLEHMTDHVGVLRLVREKLFVDGTCLVRVPVANWAWHHYKENWMQLDAPRHLLIPTPQGFNRASEAAGFRIARTRYDGRGITFVTSEMYQRDIPLTETDSEVARLGRAAMRKLNARAADLNRQGLGDQAAFYLKPISL